MSKPNKKVKKNDGKEKMLKRSRLTKGKDLTKRENKAKIMDPTKGL